ncbi:MAG: bifunctional 5,10-methylenetetrahydrofolate dehydrogenase/5,10-methenyltetrahydrofolate cyclohydrolase [Chloroflexi bacterium]|nr:bifunctional 5,10-methylenetetrahydrofolate dehydrogenase/5,10-methenyltetrahydrofolate cyclohydrolase [Chloroflexota bacterium]
MTRLLHGRPLAERITADLAARSEALKARGTQPTLRIVSVGADPAGNAYAGRLAKAGQALGVHVVEAALARDTTESELIAALERAGADVSVHGVLLLTPLPGKLDEGHIVDHIPVAKDVEGMHPFNVGFLADGRPRFVPSTAEASLELLKFYEVPLRGTRALIVGRSTVIGRPAANLLLLKDATVTIAHSKTVDLARHTRDAQVIIIATGRAGFLRGDMVSKGVVVIDAGINVTPNGIVGDVDVESVSAVADALSPVPGGLGTVTTALLLRNVLAATERQVGGG